AEDGIRDFHVTGVQTCALPISHHSSGPYISALIERGMAVAICEQLEDPSQTKGLVKRDVVRVITPGLVMDPDSLDARTPNYVARSEERRVGEGCRCRWSASDYR